MNDGYQQWFNFETYTSEVKCFCPLKYMFQMPYNEIRIFLGGT